MSATIARHMTISMKQIFDTMVRGTDADHREHDRLIWVMDRCRQCYFELNQSG